MTVQPAIHTSRRRSRGITFVLLLGCIASPVIFPVCSAASTRSAAMHTHQIDETVATIKNGHTAMERTNAANHLAQLTYKLDPHAIGDNTLNAMITLLDSPEESVRAGVAAALGNLGPRAKAAGPKLIAILPNDCLVVGLSSGGAIRLALERIGVPPPPPAACQGTR